MANANTIFALYNMTGPTSSTETAIAAVSGGTTRAILALSNNIAGGNFDGKPFKVRVVSQGKASGACNFTSTLYWDSNANTNLTTFTGDISVVSSSTQALASKNGTVFMESIFIWDSVLGQLSAFGNAAGGFAALVTTPNLINSSATKANTSGVVNNGSVATSNLVRFFVTHTMSANATSSTLLELAIDQI